MNRATLPSLAILALAVAAATGEAPSPLLDHYPDLFGAEVIEAGGRTFVARRVLEPPPDHPLAALAADHRVYLGYLLDFGASIPAEELERRMDRPEELTAYFVEALRRDPVFNSAVLPTLARALAARGAERVSIPPRRTVSLERAINIAVRFFYPDRASDDGMTGHICSGINGLADAPWERDPALEALVFSAIRRDLATEARPIQQEFVEALKSALELDLSADLETRVTRAQGAVWALLARSQHLRALVLAEYERMADLLPFELAATSPPDGS